MSDKTREILKDLIEKYPSLNKNQGELLAVIEKLLENRPEVTMSPKIKSQIRKQLLVRAKQLNKSEAKIINHNFMNAFIIKLAGAVAVVVIAVVVGITYLNSQGDIAPEKLTFSEDQNIVAVNDNGFGDLSNISSQENSVSGLGAGEFSVSADARVEKAVGIGGGGGMGIPSPYYNTSYSYVYKGDKLDLAKDRVEVYRRAKNDNASSQLGEILRQANLGLASLDTFGEVKAQHFTLAEDKEYGYIIMIDLVNGQVSINQNWERWPELPSLCSGVVRCPEKSVRFTIDDVPKDDKIIKIANDFLSRLGVKRENYGQPQVDDRWLIAYDNYEDKTYAYVPDTFTVIYPEKINGQLTHDMSGNEMGMTVTVNARHNKATGLWNLKTQAFESSYYAGLTDENRVLDILKDGGVNQYYPERSRDIVELEVGDPEEVLISHWLPTPDGTHQELFIPALKFPVLEPPDDDPYYGDGVVVPIAKDILDYLARPPIPMPLPDQE